MDATPTLITIPTSLLEDLLDDDPCDIDHNGGCQAHYLTLQPGEVCPVREAKDMLAAATDPDLDIPHPRSYLEIQALAPVMDADPTTAVQYGVRLPGGRVQVYGDQEWIASRAVLADCHPDGVIVRRPVQIAYGAWSDAPVPQP